MTVTHIVINSNKWFSAVSDYSYQLLKFVTNLSETETVFVTHPASPMCEKALQTRADLITLPFLPSGVLNFIRCWDGLSKILELRTNRTLVWTFEGREHTLCVLHRKRHPKLWENKTLVRIRGQAQTVKDNSLNKRLYTQETDKLVLAGQVVAKRFPFALPEVSTKVFHYCVDVSVPKSTAAKHFVFDKESNIHIDFSRPTFLVVGRYDPVKGHEQLLEAFAKTNLHNTDSVQLVFVGESKNVKASDLYVKARALLGEGTSRGSRFFAQSADGKRKVFIFDERLATVIDFMHHASFGIIPSLGSEVICRVAVEFLQCYTPVLASNAGALQEVIDSSCGRIFEHSNSDDMAKALEWALTVTQNKDLHTKLRTQAHTRGRSLYALANFQTLLDWVLENPAAT